MNVRTGAIEATQLRLPMPAERVDRIMVEIEKGQQVAGHFPSVKALERARRVLEGATTVEQAFAEIDARFA